MKRLIDANALIEILAGMQSACHTHAGLIYISKVWQQVKNMPTIEAEPQWTPVSERLPEYYEPVLTWDGYAFVIEQRIPYICGVNGERIQGDWWVSTDYDEIETDYYPGLRDGAAIAWMPLPKPYKGDKE